MYVKVTKDIGLPNGTTHKRGDVLTTMHASGQAPINNGDAVEVDRKEAAAFSTKRAEADEKKITRRGK